MTHKTSFLDDLSEMGPDISLVLRPIRKIREMDIGMRLTRHKTRHETRHEIGYETRPRREATHKMKQKTSQEHMLTSCNIIVLLYKP